MADCSNDNKTEITLKGSVEIVSDFFFTAINSILYQRGEWYPLVRRGLRSNGSFLLTRSCLSILFML
jgi:mitotic spindle assembly checkpoint protein MAD2